MYKVTNRKLEDTIIKVFLGAKVFFWFFTIDKWNICCFNWNANLLFIFSNHSFKNNAVVSYLRQPCILYYCTHTHIHFWQSRTHSSVSFTHWELFWSTSWCDWGIRYLKPLVCSRAQAHWQQRSKHTTAYLHLLATHVNSCEHVSPHLGLMYMKVAWICMACNLC